MLSSSTRGRIVTNHKDKPDKSDGKKYLSGRGSWILQYQDRPDDLLTRVWQKLTPEVVVEMLIDAPSKPRYVPEGKSTAYIARKLLREMRHSSWVIECAPHAGGQNNSTSKDPNLHITVRVSGHRARHLTCKEEPRLHIIGISENAPSPT